jgi:hypothetical protein
VHQSLVRTPLYAGVEKGFLLFEVTTTRFLFFDGAAEDGGTACREDALPGVLAQWVHHRRRLPHDERGRTCEWRPKPLESCASEPVLRKLGLNRRPFGVEREAVEVGDGVEELLDAPRRERPARVYLPVAAGVEAEAAVLRVDVDLRHVVVRERFHHPFAEVARHHLGHAGRAIGVRVIGVRAIDHGAVGRHVAGEARGSERRSFETRRFETRNSGDRKGRMIEARRRHGGGPFSTKQGGGSARWTVGLRVHFGERRTDDPTTSEAGQPPSVTVRDIDAGWRHALRISISRPVSLNSLRPGT